ncbi:MAG: DUF4190 domain-containing protein [Planctomycetota bacterium]
MNESPSAIPPIPPTSSPYGAAPKPHRGTLVLVLGILGLVCSCFPVGIAAWVLGHTDLGAMERGEIDPAGRSLTQAGKICGIISVVLGALGLIWLLGILVLGVLGNL